MSRKRAPSDEERELFESTFSDVKPPSKKAVFTTKPATPKPKPTPAIPPAPVRAPSSKPTGLDGRTAERLRRGMLEPEARLDLHGLTEETAHRALMIFLRSAAARGLRLVIVVTGKGLKPSAPDEPFDMELNQRTRGILKTMTPRWLAEPELAHFVADVRTAHRRHGGAGALYVYLRKSRS
jgi:DNA-nicking Smr family endonuclease